MKKPAKKAIVAKPARRVSIQNVYQVNDEDDKKHFKKRNLDDVENYEYASDDVDDEDDEEISSDDAFDAQDEERYGHYNFNKVGEDGII
jgi:U3 small nucleolar RNA-associated protein 14